MWNVAAFMPDGRILAANCAEASTAKRLKEWAKLIAPDATVAVYEPRQGAEYAVNTTGLSPEQIDWIRETMQ